MFQVRMHGRGGQGAVTAAELLAVAAFSEDHYAHAFPSFGPERTGAPVVSFCWIDGEPIRTHEPVAGSDALIIQDPTLLHQPGLLAGLSTGAYLLVNSMRGLGEIGLDAYVSRMHSGRLLVVPATQLALDHLGRPLPWAALLGGFAALTGRVRLDSLAAAIRERFAGQVAEGNVAAARAAYSFVEEGRRALDERVGA
jgi:pyruvate ferredoxin oxidoreductase gamma subunit